MIKTISSAEGRKQIYIVIFLVAVQLLCECIYFLHLVDKVHIPVGIYIESLLIPAIVSGCILSYLYSIQRRNFLRIFIKPWLPALLIELIYTYIFIHIDYSIDNYLGDVKVYLRYYRFTMVLTLLILIGRYVVSYLQTLKLVRYGIQFMVSVISAVSLFASSIYLVYFLKYNSLFSAVAFMSVLATTYAEANEYIKVLMNSSSILLVTIIVIGSIPVISYYSLSNIKYECIPRKVRYILGGLYMLVTVGVVILGRQVFPVDMYIHVTKHSQIVSGFIELEKNMDTNNGNIEVLDAIQDKEGTVILVIGESANRDYMSVYNHQLEINTTPWESQQIVNKNFIFMGNAYSNYPNTALSLSRALTQVNQYNGIKLSDAITLIGLAKKAGYVTYWISTQGKGGLFDSIVTKIGESSDNIFWETGLDTNILQDLSKINPKEKNFVVLHILGSHANYDERVPKSYKVDKYTDDIRNQYMRTIEYTDTFLKDVFEYGKNNLHLNAMVYMSDHGEHLTYGHTDNPFYFDMVRIPMWIYVSDEYKQRYPFVYKGLESNKNKIFTNDVLFELMSTLLHAHTSWYAPNYDISSDKYMLNINNALTVHGRYYIKDDPLNAYKGH